jgi:hypothetical protein
MRAGDGEHAADPARFQRWTAASGCRRRSAANNQYKHHRMARLDGTAVGPVTEFIQNLLA